MVEVEVLGQCGDFIQKLSTFSEALARFPVSHAEAPQANFFLRISAKILPQKARNHDICDKKARNHDICDKKARNHDICDKKSA
jgi:hypothetical protein